MKPKPATKPKRAKLRPTQEYLDTLARLMVSIPDYSQTHQRIDAVYVAACVLEGKLRDLNFEVRMLKDYATAFRTQSKLAAASARKWTGILDKHRKVQ
jgi:hypothetical protein